MTIHTTPDLERFEVSWHYSPDNLPVPLPDAGEFLAERFIEDVTDTCGAGSFVIIETRLPEHSRDTLIEIVFHIVTTVEGAKAMQQADFEIYPLRQDKPDWWDYGIAPHDGMTWSELSSLIQRSLVSGDIKPEEIASCTDDNDPEAPWSVFTGMVKGDNGWYLTTEEFRR